MNLKSLTALSKLGSTKVSELNAAKLTELAAQFGYDVVITDEMFDRAASALKANDIDALSELLNQPEVMAQMMRMFAPAEPQVRVIVRICEHCGQANIYEVKV